MATRQGKKQNKGTRNPDRRNGKASKKHPKPMGPRVRTEERNHKDQMIREIRLCRKEMNKARREEQERLAEELAEQVAAEVARKEAEDLARIGARVAMKKVHRAHVVA